jgi:hypothetical protein
MGDVTAYIETAIADRLYFSLNEGEDRYPANIRIFPDDSEKDPQPIRNIRVSIGYQGSNFSPFTPYNDPITNARDRGGSAHLRSSRFEIAIQVKDLRSHVPVLRLLDRILDALIDFQIPLDNAKPLRPVSDRFQRFDVGSKFWFYVMVVEIEYVWYLGQQIEDIPDPLRKRFIETGDNSIELTLGLWKTPLSQELGDKEASDLVFSHDFDNDNSI